jgi:hypothetical protein
MPLPICILLSGSRGLFAIYSKDPDSDALLATKENYNLGFKIRADVVIPSLAWKPLEVYLLQDPNTV